MFKLPEPKPDFETFVKIITGEKKADRVLFAELGIDREIIEEVTKNIFYDEWVEDDEDAYHKQLIRFFYKMGYDFAPMWLEIENFNIISVDAENTAESARGKRNWIQQDGGRIRNWNDYEKMNWDEITVNYRNLEIAEKILPDGMKVTIGSSLFEMVMEQLLGYEGLFILSVDQPDLTAAVFETWGEKLYKFYEEAVERDIVGAVFHADDLGFKTGTMLSPGFLRKHLFPWFKKFADLTHKHNKFFFYHCCGNVENIMDDLINDVKIDAFHSFQDVIITVGDFMDKYGDKTGVFGGIDVDKLSRLPENELRKYVRNTLKRTMPGRYALGSGNTVTNYIPVQNYLAMMEEGYNWRG